MPPSGASTAPVRSRQTRVRSLCAPSAICSQRVRGLVLGHHYLAEIAVIAHRGAGEKHRRRFAARCHQRHQLLGYLPAALAQALFLRRRPALVGDGLARQVDDRVEGVEIAEVIQPRRQRHGSVEPRAGVVRIAGDDRHVMPQRQQARCQRAANQTGAAGYQNLHKCLLHAFSAASVR